MAENPEGQELQDPPQAAAGVAGVSDAYHTKSTAQVDLETRLANNNRSPAAYVPGQNVDEVNAPYATEDTDTSAYRGVSPEYMTHAGVGDQPFDAEGGVEEAARELQERGLAHSKPQGLREDRATVGGGSSEATVHTQTAGDGLTSTEVDRKAVERKQQSAVSGTKTTDRVDPTGTRVPDDLILETPDLSKVATPTTPSYEEPTPEPTPPANQGAPTQQTPTPGPAQPTSTPSQPAPGPTPPTNQ